MKMKTFITAAVCGEPITTYWTAERLISTMYAKMREKGTQMCLLYGSGHETATALLPGFAINW